MTNLDNRLLFHQELVSILGSNNVYFQPPENVKINFPCIVYSLDRISKRPADDEGYIFNRRYQVLYIDRDPDSDVLDRLARYPMSSFSRYYVSDNLNHYAFTIYYK